MRVGTRGLCSTTLRLDLPMSFYGDEPFTRYALARAAEEEAYFRGIFETFARERGATLLCWIGQAYDQDQLRNQHAGTPPYPKALNGVCLALTTVWVRKNLLGQGPLQAFREKLNARGITDTYRRKQSTPTARYDNADQVWKAARERHGEVSRQIVAVQGQINGHKAAGEPVPRELYTQKLALERARTAAYQEVQRTFRAVDHEATHLHANMVCSDKHFTGVPLGDQSVYAKVDTGTPSAATLPQSLLPFITADAFYLLSFGPAGQGHVVGFTGLTHQPFRLFDANTGEFEVPAGGGQQFLADYWARIRYDVAFGAGGYTLHRFSPAAALYQTPAPPRLYPPVPWDHFLVNRFCFGYPPTLVLDTLPACTTSQGLEALRKALARNEYPAHHGGLQIFVAGPDGQEWRGAVHVALEEATALVRRRGYMLEVVPLQRADTREVEVRLYRK